MDKEARRKIISGKSEYMRKPKEWNLIDETQFRWIMLRLKRKSNIHCYGVRARVKTMLKKYGYWIYHIAENYYQIRKAE